MTPDTTYQRIEAISKRIGGLGNYLEIGVAKGATFFNVEAIEKHAVDPRFRFDTRTRSSYKNEIYHAMTSDEFFNENLQNPFSFDLIFLDGLHTYSQTLRDFLASQKLAHSKTIWLIDDTMPTDAIAAEADLSRVREARAAQGRPDDETWMGDVFKVIAFIDAFLPQFSCFSLEGHGQTLILPIPRQQISGKFKTTEEIENLNYIDALLLNNNLLKPTSFGTLLGKIDELFRK